MPHDLGMTTANEITTCQICQRAIKSAGGRIAHHGYTRPDGWHMQTASCFGARAEPWEVSCARLAEFVDHVTRSIEHQRKLATTEPESLTIVVGVDYRRYEGRKSDREYRKIRETVTAETLASVYAKHPDLGKHNGNREHVGYGQVRPCPTWAQLVERQQAVHAREAESMQATLDLARARLASWKPRPAAE